MAATLVASDIYPAVNRYLLESGLSRTLKAFEKETAAGDDAEAPKSRKKIAKAMRKIELTAACQLTVEASVDSPAALVASNIYPAVNRFLIESGLTRTLKAFEKETAAGDEAPPKKKVAKAIRKMELTAACQAMLEASAAAPTNGTVAAAEEEVSRPKKRKNSDDAAAAEPAAEPAAKKQKCEAEPAEAPQEMSKKAKKKQKDGEEKTSGVPFSRVDYSKWMATIKDERLIDNTHKAKQKFGGSVGDSWGDAAAADMLKVKGKGFRKEMAKKKRASWRGGGEIDQGTNSIRLDDSSDDE